MKLASKLYTSVRRLYTIVSKVPIERWVGSLHAGAIVRSLHLQWTLGPIFKTMTGTSLHAGCGPGVPFARLMARRFPAWHFVGLNLKLAFPQSRPPNLCLCVGDLHALPVVGPFDVIYCIDVLEHLEDVETCLYNLTRCLTPGGYIFLHVPSRLQCHFLPGVDLEYSWLGPGEPGDVHIWEGFEPEQLEIWLRKAGCQVLFSRFTFGTMTTVLKELFMLGEARRIPGIGLVLFPFLVLAAWLERHIGGRSGNGLLILAKKVDVSGEGEG